MTVHCLTSPYVDFERELGITEKQRRREMWVALSSIAAIYWLIFVWLWVLG